MDFTTGRLGIARRTVAMLDRDGDGSLSLGEAPGTKAIDRNGKPGIQVDELKTWLAQDDVWDATELLDHWTWSWQGDPGQTETAERVAKQWRTATIATAITSAALLLLGALLLVTGVGAIAALPLMLGVSSGVSSPMCYAEMKEANEELVAKRADAEVHCSAVAYALRRAAEAPSTAAKKTAQGPLAALTTPSR